MYAAYSNELYDTIYFLIENDYFNVRTSFSPYSKYWDIRYLLRAINIPPKNVNYYNKSYDEKEKLIKLIQSKGLDYYKYPPSSYTLFQEANPENWE